MLESSSSVFLEGLDDVALEPAEVLIKILGSNFLERFNVAGGGVVELLLGGFVEGGLETDEGDRGMADIFDEFELEGKDILIRLENEIKDEGEPLDHAVVFRFSRGDGLFRHKACAYGEDEYVSIGVDVAGGFHVGEEGGVIGDEAAVDEV